MKQREMELFGKRVEDADKKRQLLKTIDPKVVCSTVMPGALVSTSLGYFFIAVSADEVVINDVEYCIISIDSPIGCAMNNKSVGAVFSFRGKRVEINEIC